jgi:2-polyprenyl-3-methyl-5-hydroxy-6-metoxy-1,4-benzoquinol methylase
MKYDFSIEAHPQTKYILQQIRNETSVLEFGCHSGRLSKLLINEKCEVVGFDNDAIALENAKEFGVVTHNVDLNDIQKWSNLIVEKKFDTILFVHILEHLYSPDLILKKATNFLNIDGTIIVALPNICNAKNRFDIALKGKFEYTETGVMDKTHIKFFTVNSASELIRNAGLEIVDYYSPLQVNPLRELVDKIPFIYRLGKFLKQDRPLFLPFSKNLTDVIMVFKCRLKCIK